MNIASGLWCFITTLAQKTELWWLWIACPCMCTTALVLKCSRHSCLYCLASYTLWKTCRALGVLGPPLTQHERERLPVPETTACNSFEMCASAQQTFKGHKAATSPELPILEWQKYPVQFYRGVPASIPFLSSDNRCLQIRIANLHTSVLESKTLSTQKKFT